MGGQINMDDKFDSAIHEIVEEFEAVLSNEVFNLAKEIKGIVEPDDTENVTQFR